MPAIEDGGAAVANDPRTVTVTLAGREPVAFVAEIEQLRLELERNPDLPAPELRRRADIIADRFLALYGKPEEQDRVADGAPRLRSDPFAR